jgi:hypothetical protein
MLIDTGEGFRPIAPCLPPARAHGSSLHPTSSAPPPPGEAVRIPRTTTTPERTTASPRPHLQGDTTAKQTKEEDGGRR